MIAPIKAAIAAEEPSHIFALLSGGHDSLCATHLASRWQGFSGVAHINTGTGIPQTRDYVDGLCEAQGWPLIELRPDGKDYERLVMEKGFPGGPMSHNTMYYWLKQRQIRWLVREHKQHDRDRIGLVTGIRRQESDRRLGADISQYVKRQGAQLWLNPILDWSELDKNRYMRENDLPRNPVVDLLHKSAECLCGALARKGEFRDIELWFPERAAEIKQLEARVQAVHPGSYWGRRGERENPGQLDFLPLCMSCQSEAA